MDLIILILNISIIKSMRATLNKVLDMVKGDMKPSDVCVREPVPVQKRVAIAVFKIAFCVEYRVIGKHM